MNLPVRCRTPGSVCGVPPSIRRDWSSGAGASDRIVFLEEKVTCLAALALLAVLAGARYGSNAGYAARAAVAGLCLVGRYPRVV
jgi:hypothetical protein